MNNQIKLLQSLIARAGDRASAPNEVQKALAAAAGIAARFSKIRGAQDDENSIAEPEGTRAHPPSFTYKAYQIMRELEEEVARYKLRSERAEAALTIAERRIELLNKQLKQPSVPEASGSDLKTFDIPVADGSGHRRFAKERGSKAEYIKFADFEVRASSVFGRAGWRSALAYHLNIPIRTMSAWKTVDLVPAAIVAKLERMTAVDRLPASRQPWTPAEHQALKGLLNAGQTNLEAARTLSARFGRRLYESSIAGQRRRLRREGWSVERRAAHTGVPPLARRAAGRPPRDHAATERVNG